MWNFGSYRSHLGDFIFPSTQVNIIAIVMLIVLLMSTSFFVKNNRKEPPALLIISLDGFRHDYIERTKEILGNASLPNFDYFVAHGTRAMRLVGIFPTLTLPNHQTMVTGLYPQRHGVTANTMRDSSIDTHYLSMLNDSSLKHDPWLDGWPEPLWVTAQRDFGLSTATQLWPITDRNVSGILPRYRVSCPRRSTSGHCFYQSRRRVDDIIKWLITDSGSGKEKIRLILSYFCDVDIEGHMFGPNSTQVGYLFYRQIYNQNISKFIIAVYDTYCSLRRIDTFCSPWGIINFKGVFVSSV